MKKKQQSITRRKISMLAGACVAVWCLSFGTVRAERAAPLAAGSTSGGGIDRRVVTKEGYTDVSGTVNLSFFLPNGLTGPFLDQPSAYLGARLDANAERVPQVEIDAGLQYEPTNNAAVTARGWVAFIRADSAGLSGPAQYTNPQIWDATMKKSVAWEPTGASFSTGITSDLHFHICIAHEIDPNVDGGQVNLTVSAIGVGDNTFFWGSSELATEANPIAPTVETAPTIINSFAQATALLRVKRVIAMTRGNGKTYQDHDGSWLECFFSNGMVGKYTSLGTFDDGFDKGTVSMRPWQLLDVDENDISDPTGYDAQGDTDTHKHLPISAYDQIFCL